MKRSIRVGVCGLLLVGGMAGARGAEGAPVVARVTNPHSWAPPGLPAQVSAVQAAVQALKGATLKEGAIGSGAIRRGVAPQYTPRPSSGTPAGNGQAGNGQGGNGQGGNSNYGGSATPAPSGTTFVRITGIIVARGTSVRACNPNGNCSVEPGDILTLTAAGGFLGLGREVHFVTFPAMTEQVAMPVAWTDSAIVVQVPRLAAGGFDGAIYLGTPNSGASSTFWGYHYNPTLPTIVSQFVVFDTPPLPANVQLYRPHRFAWPETSSTGAVDGKTRFAVTRSGFFATGPVNDLFLFGGRLFNGWKVKKVHFTWRKTGLSPASASLMGSTVGTDDLSVGVAFSYEMNGGINYDVAVEIEGPDNTNPYVP